MGTNLGFIRFLWLMLLIFLFSACIAYADAGVAEEVQKEAEPVNLIINPGFEDDKAAIRGAPKGWTVAGDKKASKTESRFPHGGSYKYVQRLFRDYKVSLSQTIENIENGDYLFEFWYSSSGGQNEMFVELKDFGGDPIEIDVKQVRDWAKHETGIKISTARCTITIYSDAKAGNWVDFDDMKLIMGKPVVRKNVITNPGFEADNAPVSGAPEGWTVAGDKEASKTESQYTHGGSYKYTHWLAKDYKVSLSQTIENIENGDYRFEFWYFSGGGQNELSVGLKDFGGDPIKINVGRSKDWAKYEHEATIEISTGKCTITIYSDAKAGNWVNFDDMKLYTGEKMEDEVEPLAEREKLNFTVEPTPLSIIGADVSSLKKVEDAGGIFYNDNGEEEDLLEILKDHGFNLIRLKIWHTPTSGYCNKEKTLEMAKRIKALGFKFLLDFHYSDTWADPGKQYKPKAWEGLSFEDLTTAIYDYTKDIITSLKNQGTLPDIVQIGNEIRAGMVWPDGKLGEWPPFITLLKSAIKGAKDSVTPDDNMKIMIHTDSSTSSAQSVWFFGNLAEHNVEYDLIGLSFYNFWHGKLLKMYEVVNDIISRYNKDVVLVEIAFPHTLADADGWENIISEGNEGMLNRTGYPATVEGQADLIGDVIKCVKHFKDGRALGVVYWEPGWLGVKGAGWDPDDPESGNGWENMCLFDLDGKALESLDVFLEESKQK